MGMKDFKKSKVTRRTFLQGMVATGAVAAVSGCSRDDGDLIFDNTNPNLGGVTGIGGGDDIDMSLERVHYAICGHNCGASPRCVHKVHTLEGRITRITSDESDLDGDGNMRDKNQINDSRALACAKGRAYKHRVYNSARLKYPLKQTKERGDVTGFVRISPEQAMKEIVQKCRAVHAKYNAGGIHDIAGSSANYYSSHINPSWLSGVISHTSGISGYSYRSRTDGSDYSFHQYNYSVSLTGYPTAGSSAYSHPVGYMAPEIAGAVKNIVSWGSNYLSSNHSGSWAYIRAAEMMKERCQGDSNAGNIILLGPELSDTGITIHTKWLQSRNYTDSALIMALMYEMIVNTFDEDGNIMANPWLDVNYLDSFVYGFFDTPALTEVYNPELAYPVGLYVGTETEVPNIFAGDNPARLGDVLVTQDQLDAEGWIREVATDDLREGIGTNGYWGFSVSGSYGTPYGTVDRDGYAGGHWAYSRWRNTNTGMCIYVNNKLLQSADTMADAGINVDALTIKESILEISTPSYGNMYIGNTTEVRPITSEQAQSGLPLVDITQGNWIYEEATDDTISAGTNGYWGFNFNGSYDYPYGNVDRLSYGKHYAYSRWRNTEDDTCIYIYSASSKGAVSLAAAGITPESLTYLGIMAPEVAPGMSLSAYIMGNDARLTKAKYVPDAIGNYEVANFEAEKFNATTPGITRNRATCSQQNTKGADTEYLTKKSFLVPKTPEWAEAICGVPAAEIRKLAKMYCTPECHPILNEFSGGFQKQENGVVNLWALQALLCVTKTFGMPGEVMAGSFGGGVQAAGSSSAETMSGGTWPGTTPSTMESNWVMPSLCKEWYNSMKLAYHDVLLENGYTGNSVPNWIRNGRPRVLNDNGDAKAQFYTGYTIEDTYNEKSQIDIDGKTYYNWIADPDDASGGPLFVGPRVILNSGGGIPLNQHSNTNDMAEMYRCLPLSGSPEDADFADKFCLVQMDPYFSPSARFADYAIPVAMGYEAVCWDSVGGSSCVREPIVKAPGETLDTITWGYHIAKAHVELGSANGVTVSPTLAEDFIGTSDTSKTPSQIQKDMVTQLVTDATEDASSKYYGMSYEDAYESQFVPRSNSTDLIVSVDPSNPYSGGYGSSSAATLRSNLEAYLALPAADRKTTRFVNSTFGNGSTSVYSGTASGWSQIAAYTNWSQATKPGYSGMFHMVNNMVVWAYENRMISGHGWLPAEERGQKNEDYEGDPTHLAIPVYYYYQDNFRDSYAGFKGEVNEDFFNKSLLTLGTSHDRYRVHSTHNENPLIRELNHRVIGGKPANDYGLYGSDMSENVVDGGQPTTSKMISQAVENKLLERASWHEMWMNDEDAAARGISDGDLIRVSNPIGAIRVIARVTKRCVRGHVNLHQGGWYDPNPVDNVDDGGCANTLMAHTASKYDQGNAVQFAYVEVTKEDISQYR